jgi:hypothetical protein
VRYVKNGAKLFNINSEIQMRSKTYIQSMPRPKKSEAIIGLIQ